MATIKTGAFFSCIQVKNVPKILDVVPESEADPEFPKALSISSHHIMHGATDSAVLITDRRFSSELPTIPEKTLPISNRKSGNSQNDAIAFDA